MDAAAGESEQESTLVGRGKLPGFLYLKIIIIINQIYGSDIKIEHSFPG